MSDQAIMGSFKLWIRHQRTAEHYQLDNKDIRTEISLANQESIDDLSNDNEPQNNDDEEHKTITDRSELDEKKET
jgi:hypothetical protein